MEMDNAIFLSSLTGNSMIFHVFLLDPCRVPETCFPSVPSPLDSLAAPAMKQHPPGSKKCLQNLLGSCRTVSRTIVSFWMEHVTYQHHMYIQYVYIYILYYILIYQKDSKSNHHHQHLRFLITRPTILSITKWPVADCGIEMVRPTSGRDAMAVEATTYGDKVNRHLT